MRHVDVLQLQPNVVIVVVITSTGGVSKQRYAFPEPVDPGLVDAGPATTCASGSIGTRLRSRLLARAFDEPSLVAARARVPRRDPRRVRRRRGRAPALRRRRRRAARRPARRGDRRLPQPDGRAREARRAARRARAVVRGAPAVRPRRRRARAVRACTSSRSSARRTGSRTRPSARSACSARCGWTTRRRSAPSARRRTSSRASSKRSTRTSSADGPGAGPRTPTAAGTIWPHVGHRTRLLRAARRFPRRRRARDQEGVPRARARSCIPTSRSDPEAEASLPRGVRGVRGALEPRDARSSTTATATPASARAGSRRRTSTSAASATSSRPSSATTSSAARGAGGAARGADVAGRDRDRPRRRRPRHDGRASSSRSRSPARTCDGDGVQPGTTVTICQRCGGNGRLQQVSRSVFGEFVRTSACPECQRHRAARSSIPARRAHGAGRTLEERTLEVEVPAGHPRRPAHPPLGRGPRRRARRARGRRSTSRVRVRPDERFVREGNDIFSQVDLTIVQAALGATVAVETLDGPVELEFEPGAQPGEVRVLRGQGMPVLQGFGRGDHRVLVNVTVPRRLTDEQRRLLEEFEQPERRRDLQAGRGLLREAAGTRSADPRGDHASRSSAAEEARARFVELAPEGFEEAERGGEVELAAYGAAAERVLAAFPRRGSSPRSRRAGRIAGASSTARFASGRSGSARRGRRRLPTRSRSSSTPAARSAPARTRRRGSASSCCSTLPRGEPARRRLRLRRALDRRRAARLRARCIGGRRRGARRRGDARERRGERRRRRRPASLDALAEPLPAADTRRSRTSRSRR